MVMYTCPRCSYETSKKSDIRDHFNRKKVCKNKNNVDLTNDLKALILDRASHDTITNFITNYNGVTHIDNSITNNITNINNNNTYITLNPFGKENIEGIDLNEELKDIRSMPALFRTLVDILHFRNDENYNIMVTDKVRKNLMIFEKPPTYTSVGEIGYFRICQNIIDILRNNESLDEELRKTLLGLLHETIELSNESIVAPYAAYNNNYKRVHKKINVKHFNASPLLVILKNTMN